MTAKRPLWHNAERMDKPDVDHATRDYPSNLQKDLARLVNGVGVLDGFDVRVLSQVGPQVGQIDIFNGRGYDWNGRFINGQTGTNAQRIILGNSRTEYWIEIEFKAISSDTDQRAFWDSTVDNADPIPDGQEVPIPQIFTRETVSWRVVQPIRSNPVGLRSDGGYAPARFGDNDTYILPLYVIRTNPSGQIIAGNPDTDLYGNDLISVVTAAGTEQYVKKVGYGEARHYNGTDVVVTGRKTTDQRPRVYEPLLPVFGYGAPNEVLGDSKSDLWVRDWKSAYDHLAHAIGQIKYGAKETSNPGDATYGQWIPGTVSAVDSDWRWVDVSLFKWPLLSGSYATETDQLIGCTFHIMDGNWQGFYAQVKGNDKEDGGGTTRIYLNKQSNFPEWKEGPATPATCRVVQHRQANWVSFPTPNSEYRGLNALDDEVLAARVDTSSGVTFTTLQNCIESGKSVALTVRPIAASHALEADVPQTDGAGTETTQYTEISTALTRIASVRNGGVIMFRNGIHSFDSQLPALTLFSLSGANGLTFKGEGIDNTILDYGLSDTTIEEHKIFSLSNCASITFQDLTIRGVGQLLSLSGCTNVQFINCKIDGRYVAADRLTVSFGGAVGWLIDNCQFITAGRGIGFSSFENSTMRSSRIIGIDDTLSHHQRLLSLGSFRESVSHGNYIKGVASEYGVALTDSFSAQYLLNKHYISIGPSAEGRFVAGGVPRFLDVLFNRFVKNDDAGIPAANQGFGAYFASLRGCNIVGNYGDDITKAFRFGTAVGSTIAKNKAYGVSAATAGSYSYSMTGGTHCDVEGNYGEKAETGLLLTTGDDIRLLNNYMRDNVTGFDLQSMEDSSLIGNTARDSSVRNYDMRSANNNHVSGNRYPGTTPSTAIFDLTGGQWNQGGHVGQCLSASSPPVVLKNPLTGDATLFLDDDYLLNNNQVYVNNGENQ